MTVAFFILAAIAVAGTYAAMTLRNAVHCILALTVGFAGIAGLYLQLDAQFAGFTQLMVYIGSVAILAVFAIMMTHRSTTAVHVDRAQSWVAGPIVAAAVFAILAWAVRASQISQRALPADPAASVQQIGVALMHRFVLPLEIMGVLLTAALIGAIVIAMDPVNDHDKESQ